MLAPFMGIREYFARNLIDARRSAGLSREELADRCCLYWTEVSLLERAGREPRLGTLIKLADAVGVKPEELYAGMHWDEERQCFELEGE